MLDLFNSRESLGKRFSVRVTSKAAHDKIVVDYAPDGRRTIRVYVTAAAVKGKANEAVLKLLARSLQTPKSSLKIVSGLASKDKVIAVLP